MDWIKRVRELARDQCVELSEEEVNAFSRELPKILEWFDALDEVEISESELNQPTLVKIRAQDLPQGEAKKSEWNPFCSAVFSENNFFKGPKTIKVD